jgi:hypothetical protein
MARPVYLRANRRRLTDSSSARRIAGFERIQGSCVLAARTRISSMELTVSIPADIANELFVSGACEYPLGTRADPTTTTTVVQILGAAGGLASVVVAIPVIREFSRKLVDSVTHRHARTPTSTIELQVMRPDGTVVNVIASSIDSDDAASVIAEALTAAAGPPSSAGAP